MKKSFTLTLAVLTLAILCGCHRDKKEFATTLREDTHQMILTQHDDFWPDDTMGLKNRYSLVWPTEGALTPEAEQELLLRCFGDSAASSFEQAAERWLNTSWLYEEDMPSLKKQTVDSIPDGMPYNYGELRSEYSANGNIGTFSIFEECSAYLAAHGMYFAQYLNIDLNTRQVIHLNDLVDTTQLGEVIVRAVEDLTVNKDVLDCLFDDYQQTGRLPVPQDFLIDSTRSTITLVYQLYEIAPYACGIQSIVLPIFWLSKHIPLTPYAKELFGEGCSL